jgi:hypothetical protein
MAQQAGFISIAFTRGISTDMFREPQRRLAGEPQTAAFVHDRTLLPRHHFLPKKGRTFNLQYASGTICHACVRPLSSMVKGTLVVD